MYFTAAGTRPVRQGAIFLSDGGNAGSRGDKVFEAVKDVIIEAEFSDAKREQLTRKADLEIDLGLDSLDIVELVMDVEEQFKIDIPSEQSDKIKTLGDLVDCVKKNLKKP